MQRSPLRELDCFLESFRGLRSPEHEARELMPVVDEDAFYSLESSALPLLGTKTHFSEVGLRDAGPAHLATRGPFFLSP